MLHFKLSSASSSLPAPSLAQTTATEEKNDFYVRWRIDLDNDVGYNTDCGNGCLDNFRGRCGVITDWGCSRDGNGIGHYDFSTSTFCTPNDINSALLARTRGEQRGGCTAS